MLGSLLGSLDLELDIKLSLLESLLCLLGELFGKATLLHFAIDSFSSLDEILVSSLLVNLLLLNGLESSQLFVPVILGLLVLGGDRLLVLSNSLLLDGSLLSSLLGHSGVELLLDGALRLSLGLLSHLVLHPSALSELLELLLEELWVGADD